MAEKRMFTMKICDSDAFLDMPLSTQCLYFHLNMRADDDGFIGNPKRIQKIVSASEDDLKLLIVKRFIIAFEDGVIVIKHWKMHNTIQGDRYKPTSYQDELNMLLIKDNKSYSLCDKEDEIEVVNKLETNCLQNVSTVLDIDLDLVLDKGNNMVICEQNEMWFEQFWNLYPKKVNKKLTKYRFKSVKSEIVFNKIMEDVSKRLNTIEWTKEGGSFIPHASTYLNQERWEDEEITKRTIDFMDIE